MKGVPEEWKDEDLDSYFKNYGPVRSAKIARDKVTGLNKGFGYVWFSKPRDANAAMCDQEIKFEGKHRNGAEKIPFELAWYQIKAQRPSADPDCKFFDQI